MLISCVYILDSITSLYILSQQVFMLIMMFTHIIQVMRIKDSIIYDILLKHNRYLQIKQKIIMFINLGILLFSYNF